MIYDRATIASLKLNNSIYSNRLTRVEFFTRLQLIRSLDSIVEKAYREVEEQRWRHDSRSPHGYPWHTSHHASEFPDSKFCIRRALYGLMDFPPPEPFSRFSRTIMEAGKAIEVELVRTFQESGKLLSAGPEEEIQTGFQIPEYWLTGSVDCVIENSSPKPIPVEIKTKAQEKIDEMKIGIKGPDEKHVTQLKAQLGFIRNSQTSDGEWKDRPLVTHGYLYYLSRDKPSDTAEFRVDYDDKFWKQGLDQLAYSKSCFENNELPSITPSKKHPMGWHWSKEPCKWCPHKRTCQKDHERGVTKLTESVGIGRARLVRKDYDAEEARNRVFERWESKQ